MTQILNTTDKEMNSQRRHNLTIERVHHRILKMIMFRRDRKLRKEEQARLDHIHSMAELKKHKPKITIDI